MESLQAGNQHSSTHPLHGPLKGWDATDVKGFNSHRITHRSIPGGPLEIGHIGPHNYDQAVQRLAMGQAGPDYDNLSFHVGTHPLYPEETTLFAHHPDHGDVGRLTYREMDHPKGWVMPEHAVHVMMMHTEPDHQRRGVASQMMDHLENHMFPNTPIDHGSRMPDGNEWAKHKYNDSQGGKYDQFKGEFGHGKSSWTMNGKPWNVETKKFRRMPKKVEAVAQPIDNPHEYQRHMEGKQHVVDLHSNGSHETLCLHHAHARMSLDTEHNILGLSTGLLPHDHPEREYEIKNPRKGQCNACASNVKLETDHLTRLHRMENPGQQEARPNRRSPFSNGVPVGRWDQAGEAREHQEFQPRLPQSMNVQRAPEGMTFQHEERESGGSKWPTEHFLHAIHPGGEHMGQLRYLTSPRGKSILIHSLDVHPGSRRQGVGSALMDEMQNRHPDASIDHGDRTDDGKSWWSGYTQGKPVRRGRTAGWEEEPEDYHMQHRPPGRDGMPLHDLTHDLPEDVYTHPHYYSDMSEKSNQEAHRVIGRVRGNPDAKVHIYRALPAEHAHQGFRPGDWVSTSKDYARQHGLHNTDSKHDWPVIHTTVRAGDLHTDGDDLREYGYNGSEAKPGNVAFKGGHHQEISDRAEGGVRRVERRESPTKGYSFVQAHDHLSPDDRGQVHAYAPDESYAGHIKYRQGEAEEVHVDPEHQHVAGELERRMRMKMPKESSFTPTKRVFTATCGLDHRLFDGDHLKPDVRKYIMRSVIAMWARFNDISKWSIVYFAGSEASEWTDTDLEGNNDFDVLIGVDYDGFRKANPKFVGLSNEDITNAMNSGFRPHNGPVTLTIDGKNYGPFDRTTYVNPDSYDIKRIRPYAAYNVSEDSWAVKPPHLPHWSLSDLPGAVQKVLRACDTLANDVLKLPEPERTQQGNALFESWHSDRSRAFSDRGEGWYDIANLREKWLDQEGVWAELVNCAHRWNEGQGKAPADWSNTPTGYTAAKTAALYHWAPKQHRNDIAQHGLDFRRSPHFRENAQGVHGNFFHKDEETARDWVPKIEQTHDLYEVRHNGLKLHDDPYDSGDASYTTEPVSPDRIRMISAAQREWGTFYHGTPSGDMRGGEYGLHVGTQQAAHEALTSRIGHPVEGHWDGTREYGKTLLAGRNTLHERGIHATGYNASAPHEDHYPTGEATYGDRTPVPHHARPAIFPVRIKGEMSNTPETPHEDFKANGYMKAQISRGNARRGYFYHNVGEDAGSISAVVPGPNHVERLDH